MDHAGFRAVHDAFVAGDLAALRAALGAPADFPNTMLPFELAMGEWPLIYAIAWSPLTFIETLLGLGASIRPPVTDGFPPLLSALSSNRQDVLDLLLRSGADPNERGLFDMTPLHLAVSQRNLPAIRSLLAHGADPGLRTRVDDQTTPVEDARARDFPEAVALMQGPGRLPT